MKTNIISFKTVSIEGLKAKTRVWIDDKCICINRRQFTTIECEHTRTLRKIGNLFFVEYAIAFKADSWKNITEIVKWLE